MLPRPVAVNGRATDVAIEIVRNRVEVSVQGVDHFELSIDGGSHVVVVNGTIFAGSEVRRRFAFRNDGTGWAREG